MALRDQSCAQKASGGGVGFRRLPSVRARYRVFSPRESTTITRGLFPTRRRDYGGISRRRQISPIGEKKKQTTEGKKRPEISLSGANEAARGEKRRLSALTLRARGSGATNPGKVGGAESGVCRRRDRRSLCLLSPAPGGGKINRRMNIYGVCLAEYRFAVRRSLVITQRRLSCAPRVHITHIVGGLLMPLRPPGGTDDAAVINVMYRSRSKRRECLRHK